MSAVAVRTLPVRHPSMHNIVTGAASARLEYLDRSFLQWLFRAQSVFFFWRARVSSGQAPRARPWLRRSLPAALASITGNEFVPAMPVPTETVPLIVPKGMAVQIALDKEVRVPQSRSADQRDTSSNQCLRSKSSSCPWVRLSQAKITKIGDGLQRQAHTRRLGTLNLPPRAESMWNLMSSVLPDGKHLLMSYSREPGLPAGLFNLLLPPDADKRKASRDEAAERAKEAKARSQARMGLRPMQQAKQPGKAHQIERYAVAELPVASPVPRRPAPVYVAELLEPLDFGTEPLTRPELAASLQFLLRRPDGSYRGVHAW